MWNFAQTFPSAIFHEIRWQKSCDIIKSTVFQIQNFEKNWLENVHVGLENDWSGGFVLLYGWNNEASYPVIAGRRILWTLKKTDLRVYRAPREERPLE